jgi:hypothetical protein
VLHKPHNPNLNHSGEMEKNKDAKTKYAHID